MAVQDFTVKPKEGMNAAFFNRILEWVSSRIVAGGGVKVRRGNGQIIISADTGGPIGIGGGGETVPRVRSLPAIPSEPRGKRVRVLWMGPVTAPASGGDPDGSGDDQEWFAYAGIDTVWQPSDLYSDLVGTPGP